MDIAPLALLPAPVHPPSVALAVPPQAHNLPPSRLQRGTFVLPGLRRAQAVREQMRKMALGGAPGSNASEPYVVSDSEDEDLNEEQEAAR